MIIKKSEEEDTFDHDETIRIQYQKRVNRGRTSISTASPACLELSMKCHVRRNKT